MEKLSQSLPQPLTDGVHSKIEFLSSFSSTDGGNGEFSVSNINATLCTHYVYAYASLDASTFQVKSTKPSVDITNTINGNLAFTALKSINPKAKFSTGLGWPSRFE